MENPTLQRRGLTRAAAIAYLGIGQREFRTNWLPHLTVVIAGNRKLIDRCELDALFEARKTMSLKDRQAGCDERVSRDLNAVLIACRQQSRKRHAASRRGQAVPLREGGVTPWPS